ncbi:MAG: calcineurin-like phosphoesterase family protein [Brevibacterium sp.]|nr:calcineurin-like phosphoesterase family protein [Brevibacterium sp.]MDN5834813.1 calcineurin-like phosphoesterase family protein [Brevibacterium sp.]MDN5909660.1 calcineurin-like phosphoesterase family protein [Brevibacterium sp.]MDN6175807.1 calcineurin-like phosphoesterase family protein [Brevibacterium sp.]MDN6189295.1 calcineurin-like phosphoesterase family protein [Brevibacterium sp.]
MFERRLRPSAVAGLSACATLAVMAPLVGASTALAADAPAELYEGHVQVDRGQADDPQTLHGQVFDDVNENSKLDGDETGIPGVAVTNGIDVVQTDGQGNYDLPVRDNMTVSITQPSGWQVPVDSDNFAQFSYNHLPEGSPGDFRYGGIKPTGETPQAVNFPMIESEATASAKQDCAIASDTQAYDTTEMGYARDGAVGDLADRNDYKGCGVLLLGDNVGDDLSLNDELRDIYSHMNGPVRAAPGNHDQDYDSPDDAHALDTFRDQFGPGHFSYDVGKTHFVVLDSIEYSGNQSTKKYKEKIGKDQLEWLANDLANVPKNAHVVIATHAPIVDHQQVIVDDATDLYDVIADYPNAVTIGGHTHTQENLIAGEQRQEWANEGIDALPNTQIVAGAVSGDWYSGGLNADGLPYAFTRDGSEPGVLTLSFDGAARSERYTVRNESDDHQLLLGVNSPEWREWAQEAQDWQDADKAGTEPEAISERVVTRDDLKQGETWLTSSFLAGTSDARVEMSFDGKANVRAEHTQPGKGEPLAKGWEYTDPNTASQNLRTSGSVGQTSSHLWRAEIPADLDLGTHSAEVTGTDRYGRQYTETIRFTVVEDEAAAAQTSKKQLVKDGFDTQQETKVDEDDRQGLDSDEARKADSK